MLSSEQFNALLVKARKTNEERDAVDGDLAPDKGLLASWLATAAGAIETGVLTEDVNCVAEGLCMLKDVVEAVRTGKYGPQLSDVRVGSN